MKQRVLYLYYYLKHIHHKLRAKRTGSYNVLGSFLGIPAPTDEEANELIKDFIKSGKPFAIWTNFCCRVLPPYSLGALHADIPEGLFA